MKPLNELSREYQRTDQLLGSGWSGSFGELAQKLGRTTRSALLAVRMVNSYRARHPDWDSSLVYRVT